MSKSKNFQFINFVVFLMATINLNSFGQGYKALDRIELIVSYDVFFKPDSSDLEYILNEEYTLFIGANLFQSQSTNSLIPILYIKNNDVKGFAKALSQGKIHQTSFNTTHYINYPKGEITAHERLGMDEFIYTIPMESLNWVVHPDKKTIGGFEVQRAQTKIGGREWVAWFTREIPYSAGPYLFHGLPGLIIKINDTKEHYVFELTGISEPEVFKHIEISNVKFHELSKAKFFELRDRFNQNPHANIMQSIEATGGSLTFDDPATAQRSANEASRRRNNPIELKAD
ncbi:MAG: GLPGLI family protein [bacterium]